MDPITRRCYLILSQIAEASGYLSSGEIAGRLQVSGKTVRTDLQRALPLIAQAGIRLEKKPGLGYRMDAASAQLWRRKGKSLLERRSYSVRERRFHYILQRLLSTEGYLKSAALADELFVSQTVVSAELRPIRDYLAEYELVIENTPSHGIRISGREQYIRSCMLSEYCQERVRQISPPLCPAFQALFQVSAQQGAQIAQIVRVQLLSKKERPYYVFEGYVDKIVCALFLTVNCAARKNPIRFSEKEIHETQLTRSYQAAKAIAGQLAAVCGIALTEGEVLYLGNLLLGYRSFLRFEDVSVKENYYRTSSNSSTLLMNLLTRYGAVESAYNKTLREKLALYLLALEARLRTHVALDDGEILWEMNQHAVIAKEFAIYAGLYLEELYHCALHQSEYERLTLVFLADIAGINRRRKTGCDVAVLSCKYPRDIALAIAQQHLNACEGLVKQAVALEGYQTDLAAESRCDLLLTDLPREAFPGFSGSILPYAFDLSEADYRRVLAWYHGRCEGWQRLRQMFSPRLFFPDCRAETFSALKKLVHARLLEAGAVDEGIFYDLCDAPHPCACLANNGIGFLKTRYTYGERSFCAVFRFSETVDWHGRELHTLLVLGVGAAAPSDFLLFNGWLEALLQDPQPPFPAAAAVSYPAFMETLHAYLLHHGV